MKVRGAVVVAALLMLVFSTPSQAIAPNKPHYSKSLFSIVHLRSPEPTVVPTSTPAVTLKPTPQPTLRPKAKSSTSASGVPTWYCLVGVSRCTRGYPDTASDTHQYYAAAGASLRVGDWRGRIVTVTAPSGLSIQVKLIDWCACNPAQGHFLDLYHDAWIALGKPRHATVTWSK